MVYKTIALPLSYKGIWWRGEELNLLPEAYETSVQPLHFPTMILFSFKLDDFFSLTIESKIAESSKSEVGIRTQTFSLTEKYNRIAVRI